MPDVVIPETLVEHVGRRLCIPWCGAGASVASGLPVWHELVGHFIEACERNGLLDPGELEQLEGLRQAGYLDDVVQYCRGRLGEGEYRDFLTKLLATGDPSPTHRALAKLPVLAMLTTNFDPLLERAIAEERGEFPPVLTNHDTSALWRRFARGEFFLPRPDPRATPSRALQHPRDDGTERRGDPGHPHADRRAGRRRRLAPRVGERVPRRLHDVVDLRLGMDGREDRVERGGG